jgi:subtilisin family serine protease
MRRFAFLALPLLQAACGGSGDSSSPAFEATQLLVMLENPDDADEIEDLREDFGGVAITRIGTSPFFVLDVPAGTDIVRLQRELNGDLRVVDATPNYRGQMPEGDPSHQPTFGDDDVAAIALQPALAVLDLGAAHALGTGAGVVVAVVDTGIDPAHPAVAGRIAPNGFDFVGRDADPTEERNFTDDDRDGLLDEQYGHGTFVASIVLAVAPDARVLPVRCLDDEGVGTVSSIAAGVYWAVDAGAQVVNVSVEVPETSGVLKHAIDYAHDRGVLLVAAAGNGGRSEVTFPARYGGVVAVAAVTEGGVAAPFTNFGSAVSVVAPGVAMLGAMPFDVAPAGTARWSGTSFAAPVVSGVAALVRARFPALSREAVRKRIEAAATPVDALNPSLVGRLGRGLVNAAAAVS